MYKPNLEALKEIGRWLVLFIVSWIIAETLKQVANVPEWYTVKVWVFTYAVPVRTLFTFGLTLAGRYVDKYLHEKAKLKKSVLEAPKPNGLLPF